LPAVVLEEPLPDIPTRVALALAMSAVATAAFGQNYPSRPITLIVPYAAGGSVDAVARIVTPGLGARLGQSVVIENVAGAGGIVGTQRAARAAPDGYTLLFSVESTMAIAKLVQPSTVQYLLFSVESTMAIAKLVQPSTVQYDSQKDFAPISLIGTSPLVLAGKKELPAATTDELIKLLRANPGKYSYATSGTGTSLHVAGEMINLEGKVTMVHVPYRVGAQMVTDLVGNQIDLAMLPLVMALPNYRSGNIKVFGTTEPERSPAAPDLPSLAEHPDLKHVNVTVWFGMFSPAKTDRAIVERLHQALAGTLQEADVRAKLAETGLRLVGNSPDEFATFLAQEIEKFTAIVKAANIKAE
jgi:tripartite-type tricarboxylate transporter receptor subunit TctC